MAMCESPFRKLCVCVWEGLMKCKMYKRWSFHVVFIVHFANGFSVRRDPRGFATAMA